MSKDEDVLLLVNFLRDLDYEIPVSDEKIIYTRVKEKLMDMDYPNNEDGIERVMGEWGEEIINPQRSLGEYERFN